MQYKVLQIKLKVLPSKIKLKDAAQAQVQGQAPHSSVNNNAQVGQNVLVQPPQQLAPAHQSPLVWWCLPLKYFIKIG